jgi:hypothetical protein
MWDRETESKTIIKYPPDIAYPGVAHTYRLTPWFEHNATVAKGSPLTRGLTRGCFGVATQ